MIRALALLLLLSGCASNDCGRADAKVFTMNGNEFCWYPEKPRPPA